MSTPVQEANGGQRWVGEVNASLRAIAQDISAIRSWQVEHDKRDTSLFAKLNQHLGRSAESEENVSRRLDELNRVDDLQWEAINEIRRLVWKGVGVAVAATALLTWFLDHVLPR